MIGPRSWFTETVAGLPRLFWRLWLVTLIIRSGNFVVVYLTLYLSLERELPAGTIGVLLGLMGAGAVAGNQLSGVLTDRWGRRRTLLLSIFATVAVLAAMAVTTTTAWLGALLVGFGAALNLARPAYAAMIIDVVAPADRVRAFTLAYWANNLGFAVAALLAAAVAGVHFQLIFAINAATAAAAGILVWLTIPETRPAPAAVPSDPRSALVKGGYRAVLADRVFLGFVGLVFLTAFLQTQLESLLALQVTEAGLSRAQYSAIIAVNGIAIVAGQLFVPRLVAGARHGRVLALAALLWSIGAGLTGFAGTAAVFMLSVLIWTVGEMLQTPGMSAILADLSPVDMRGRYQATFTLAWQLSALLAPPLGGFGLQHLGSLWWLLGAGIGVAAAIGHLAAEPARRRRLAATPRTPGSGAVRSPRSGPRPGAAPRIPPAAAAATTAAPRPAVRRPEPAGG